MAERTAGLSGFEMTRRFDETIRTIRVRHTGLRRLYAVRSFVDVERDPAFVGRFPIVVDESAAATHSNHVGWITRHSLSP